MQHGRRHAPLQNPVRSLIRKDGWIRALRFYGVLGRHSRFRHSSGTRGSATAAGRLDLAPWGSRRRPDFIGADRQTLAARCPERFSPCSSRIFVRAARSSLGGLRHPHRANPWLRLLPVSRHRRIAEESQPRLHHFFDSFDDRRQDLIRHHVIRFVRQALFQASPPRHS